MVLPAPPPDDAPREGAWLDAILRELKLSGEGRGLLILVDHARPERLRDLVLALLPTYPDVEVSTDVRAVYEVPEGAVMVLSPRAEDADWLNQQRPVFARRKLKVILWCDAETSVTLAQQAVDFFDWISHRHECPPGTGLPEEGPSSAWATFFAIKDALQRSDLVSAYRWSWHLSGSVADAHGRISVEQANAHRAHALLLARVGRLPDATFFLREALRIAEIRLGGENSFLGGLYGDLAEVLAQKGDFDEALRLAERAFQIEKGIPSLSSPYMSRAYKRFAYIQSLRDRVEAPLTPTPPADKTTASPPPPSPDTPPGAAPGSHKT